MQRNSHPLAWRPSGISDTLDASTASPGVMGQLSNLIPDPTTKNLWQNRPAAVRLTTFPGFSSPGFISAILVVGTRCYGMIATSLNAGNDQPFSYNLLTNTFDTVSGITAGNTPISPATSGAWVPPTMALIGTKIIVTHPGFNGGNGYIGVLDISTLTAPAWSSGNLTGAITFITPPNFVFNFNGRAYYLVNPPSGAQPAAVFSDVLVPTNVTNANQVLTFGDNQYLTAIGGLALFNQLGGIIQSAMVFKNTANIYQVTGDAALSNLSVNTLNITTGTLAPNSVSQTSEGLAFIAPDGVRLISFDAKISEPIGIDGQGIVVPFIYSNVPSRMVTGANGSLLRCGVQNAKVSGTPFQEYWLDFSRKGIWSGPHTFVPSLVDAYNNTFIMTPIGVTGSLWQSDTVQSVTSTFVENGNQMRFDYRSPNLPDIDEMVNTCITESSIDAEFSSSVPSVTVSALDQNGSVIDSLVISGVVGSSTIWGSFTWGAATWGGGISALAPARIPWRKPIVWARGQIDITGNCGASFKIGCLHLRYQKLRQLVNIGSAA
jgi:hypothetical protein